jgi:CheY-like chemotaxis protein
MNPISENLIAFTLRFAGHDVVTVGNGVEAVESRKRAQPDLILMDVRMPRMTGYEACQLIKADLAVQHIPVVFLSAKGQDAEIRIGIEAGASDYLLKPFAPNELTEHVTQLLERFGR